MVEPIYENQWVKLYQGDCLQVMSELDTVFDCCITDPPYGTSHCMWDSVIPFQNMWRELKRLVKDNGAICLFGGQPFSSQLRCSNLEMFKYDWVWIKNCPVGFANAKLKPMNRHEIISVFSKGSSANGGNNNMIYNPQGLIYCHKSVIPRERKFIDGYKMVHTVRPYVQEYTNYPDTVLVFDKDTEKLHPTQKPVALLEYLIKTYSNENDMILDFTAGSGTTGVACMELNRKCVLIEMQEKYCKVIMERLQEKEKQIAERLF